MMLCMMLYYVILAITIRLDQQKNGPARTEMPRLGCFPQEPGSQSTVGDQYTYIYIILLYIYIYYIHLYSIYRLHHHEKVVEKPEYKNLSASHLLIYKLFSSDMHGIGESRLACSIHAASK